MQILCIDPAIVARLWPHARDLIHAAMRRGDVGSFQPVEHSVLAGRALLWLATDGVRIHAAAVTELHAIEWRKVCVIVACGGKDMRLWLHLIEAIEQFGRDEGCSAMRIVGRKGWARVLGDYRTRRIILEKEIADEERTHHPPVGAGL
jgi:hypothetical protein